MHLILILDGFGYDVVKNFKQAGGFKGFHGPSAVVAPYPSMTDLCVQDLVRGEPCTALEARYFDRKANRVKGGMLAYLMGQNQPYRTKLDWRAASWLDAVCYIAPWLAFKLELRGLKSRFFSTSREVFVGYLVTTAGIGTKYGTAGQNICLGYIEDFCADIMEARPGLRITLVSDHGHGYVRSYPYDIRQELRNLGWNPNSRLEKDNDVVYPAFGLVHCAGFYTKQPERLAKDLAQLACAELVTYKTGDKVVILTKGKRAYVWPSSSKHARERGNPPLDPSFCWDDDDCRFTYLNVNGDPLELELTEGSELEMTNNEWLNKSLMHRYPCAPQRLWRAHTDLVQNTPDVILALKNGYVFGSKLLSIFAHVESTHGGLNRSNSLAFRLDTRHLPEYIVTSREALAPSPVSSP